MKTFMILLGAVMLSFAAQADVRVWTMMDGRTLEAEYLTTMGKQLVVKTSKGQQIKIPIPQLSKEDQVFLELMTPPVFNIEFIKLGNALPPPKPTPWVKLDFPLRLIDYTFGVKLKPKSSFTYNHELLIEYFAVGEEVDGDNYILFDRKESRFTPDEKNKGIYTFKGNPIRVKAQQTWPEAPMRGAKYGGFLILITDERGDIIQYKASHEFLYESLENLRQLPLGRHFNKEGVRVSPPRPKESDRNPWGFN